MGNFLELYPWQVKVIGEAPQHPKRGLFAAPRLGKTRATALMLDGRIVVVAPLSVCGGWVEELEAQGLSVYPAYKTSAQEAARALYGHSKSMDVVVVNYDKMPDLEQALKGWKYDGLVFDESHLLKNPQSRRSKAARRLSSRSGFTRILTGTPSPNHYGDLWAQMTLVNPNDWGKSFGPFAQKFLIRHAIYPSKIIGHNNVEELRAMILADADIIRREDVFGPDTYQTVVRDIELPPRARDIYNQLVKEWLYYHERGEVLADHALKRLIRLQQLTSGYLRTEQEEDVPVHTAKIDAVLADLEEIIASGEKAILFHRFTWEGQQYADEIARRFPDTPVVRIQGASSPLERETAIRTIRTHGGAAVCVAQTQTAALGVSFAEATHALFVSQSFSFTDEEQARDRIYKPGHNRCLTYYRCTNTVDQFIGGVLEAKRGIHEAVTNADVKEMAYGRIK